MQLPNTEYLVSRKEDIPKFNAVRAAIQHAMIVIDESMPDGRRKSIAVSSLDDGLLNAVRGITEANR